MKVHALGKVTGGQDGAVCNGFLFLFDAKGNCRVYDVNCFEKDPSREYAPVARFTLDKADVLTPHSNSVMFSNIYYCEGDEFPLLYTNIYNNYSAAENKQKGVTCVYRVQKNGNTFSTTLVQLIQIGFTEDPIWRSENGSDVRPYGNFVIDREKALYYAFTMRDEDRTTRYFAFDLPKPGDGEYDEAFGVNRVVLEKANIKDRFDCAYHRYIQGACFHEGLIYSLEGFTNKPENPPAMRIIDVAAKQLQKIYAFADFGLTVEPEMIDFEKGICYYADHYGNLYQLEF